MGSFFTAKKIFFFFVFCFIYFFCLRLLGLNEDLLGLGSCGAAARGWLRGPIELAGRASGASLWECLLRRPIEDAHEAPARVLRHRVVDERLELLRAIDVDGAHAVEAREGAARRDVHEEACGETAERAPRVRVLLPVGDPVVVLDVLGEVAELLGRRVGEAWHGAQALAEAVVVVVAAHVIEPLALIAGEGRWLACVD